MNALLRSDSSADAAPAEVPERPTLSVGEQLRAAREAAGQSAADVAKTLKLGVRQIEALENGDWSGLPGATFVRGFVRNYARLFRLDADRLVRALDDDRLPQAPQLHMPSTTSEALPEADAPHRRDFAALLSAGVMVALAVAAYFFLPQNFWQTTQADLAAARQAVERLLARPSTEPAAAAVAPPATARASEPQTLPLTVKAVPETPPLLPASVTATAPLPAPVPAAAQPQPPAALAGPAVAAGDSGVHLSFAKPSWVEIRDRNGMVIFSQLNPADSQRYIEGELPFSLTIGNARHVLVKFRGKPVDLAQRSKDDVARLTLE